MATTKKPSVRIVKGSKSGSVRGGGGGGSTGKVQFQDFQFTKRAD